MGWWSCTLFGGDPPLDALASLARAAGFRSLTPPDEWRPGRAAQVAARLDRIIQNAEDHVAETRAVARRGSAIALATLAMKFGVPIPGPLRTDALRALETEIAAADAWMASKRGRENGSSVMLSLDAHVNQVRRHLAARLAVYAGVPERNGSIQTLPMAPAIVEVAALLRQRVAEISGLTPAQLEPALSPYAAGAFGFTPEQDRAMRAALPVLVADPSSCVPQWTQDSAVRTQVAAALVLACGKPMPTAFRALAIEATLADPWALTNQERAEEMADLRARIAAYQTGDVDVVATVTLGAAFAAHTAQGKTRLINKR